MVPSKSYDNQKKSPIFFTEGFAAVKAEGIFNPARPQVHIALSTPYKTSILLHLGELPLCSTGAPACA